MSKFLRILFLSTLLFLFACGSEEAANLDPQIVKVVDDEFSPRVLRVDPGTTVIWESGGANNHNVIASDGSWQAISSDYFEYGIITKGDQYEHTFNEPGVYEYYCPYHGTNNKGMVGTIVVGDVDYTETVEAVSVTLTDNVLKVGKNEQYATIQDAVNSANTGDLVLISPGVYNESVTVTTSYLTLRGTDRNKVIIDGEFMRENGIQIYETDGVTVENLSVRNFSLNGVYWNTSKGFKGSYLTVYNNIWRDNMSGIVPNTLDSELNPPGRETTIVGNLVIDNNNYEAPTNRFGVVAKGMGIVVPGRVGDIIEKNLVVNHDRYGIVASPMLDANLYFSQHVIVRDNVVLDSGYTDLALAGPWGPGNCFEDNVYQTSTPPLLEQLHNCSSIQSSNLIARFPLQGDPSGLMMLAGFFADAQTTELDINRYKEYPWPKEQENMQFADINKPSPAIDLFYVPDLDSIQVPTNLLNEDLENYYNSEKEIIMSGVPISSPTIWQLLFQLYGYLMPFVLYAAWAALAIKDIDSNNRVNGSMKYVWLGVVYLVPFFGVLVYHLAGPSAISRSMKLAAIVGGLFSYIAILVAGAVISGLV